MDDIEQQWAALNGGQATLSDDRQILQREQDHFGFIVIGSPLDEGEVGKVIVGIRIGLERTEAPDIKVKVIGASSREEWRTHVLFNFGPLHLAEFETFAALCKHIVRAIAE